MGGGQVLSTVRLSGSPVASAAGEFCLRASIMRFVVAFPVLVLALLWGGQAQAAVYGWYMAETGAGNLHASPELACRAAAAAFTAGYGHTYTYKSVTYSSADRFVCKHRIKYLSGANGEFTGNVFRVGDSCPNPDDIYNAQTGTCEVNCSATEDAVIVHMMLNATRASVDQPWSDDDVTTPYNVCAGSCRYSAASSSGEVKCGTLAGDPLNQYCVVPYTGQGISCVAGDAEFHGQSTNPNEQPNNEPPKPDPDDPTDPAYTCNITPGYAWSGSVCTPIFEDDPDYDDDGGDTGDGDPDDGDNGGGDTGGGDTGGGDTGGGDTGGETGGGGSGGDGADDTPYDPEAEWNDAEAGALGSTTGATIADNLSAGVSGALEERDLEITEALDQVPDTVNDWFGDLPGLSFMDNLFVPAAGCSITTIPLELNGYDFSIAIDFCVLSKYKTLLEWVIWCLTAIAVWNVYYSGLRLQNAAASRGGF